MKQKRIFWLFIVLLEMIGINFVRAQINSTFEMPQKYFGVPSPTVASLGKFINFPTVKNTGVPDIGIGLFDIQEGDLKMPVSINYHAAGVKVDQQASWVGMNWSLQSSGVITRTVMDRPDDYVDRIDPYNEYSGQADVSARMEYYGWLDPHGAYYLGNMQTWPNGFCCDGCDGQQAQSTTLNGTTINFTAEQLKAYCIAPRLRSAHEYLDTEPDVFMVSVNGLAVKFIFDRQRNIRILGNQDVKIIPVYQTQGVGIFTNFNIKEFIVIDPSGTKYEFKEREYSTTVSRSAHYYIPGTFIDNPVNMIFGTLSTSNPYSVTHTYTSAWMLTKVISVSGFSIDYSYNNNNFSYNTPLAEFRNACDNSRNIGHRYPSKMSLDVYYAFASKVLSEINTSTQRIVFHVSAPGTREDIAGDVFLSEIVIQSKISPSGLNTLRKFKFNYYYTESNCDNLNYNSSFNIIQCQNSNVKRLFLSNIQETGRSDSDTKRPYIFTYNTTPLPPKYSSKQDFWGYFNNNSSQGSMIPALYVYPTLSGADRYRIYPFNNNSDIPNPIYLPGQDRNVNYNVNQAGVLVKIQYPTGGWSEYEYESNNYFDPVAQEQYLAGGLRIKKIRFVESTSNNKIIEKEYSYNKMEEPTKTSGVLISCPQHAFETAWGDNPNVPDPQLIAEEDIYPYPLYGDPFFPSNPINNRNDYYYVYAYDIFCWKTGTGNWRWGWPEAGANDQCIYNASTDPNLSDYDRWNIFTRRFSYSLLPLSNLDGSIVQYTDVTVKETDLGKTVTQYHPPVNYRSHATTVEISATSGSLFGNVDPFEISYGQIQRKGINSDGKNIYPFPPMSYPSSEMNGEVKYEYVYSETGKLLKSKYFEYNFVKKNNDNLIYGLRLSISNTVEESSPFSPLSPIHYAKYQYVVDQEPMLERVTEKNYSQTDNNFTEHKVEYSYNFNHTKPVVVKTFNSDNTVYINSFRYPKDIPGQSSTLGGDAAIIRKIIDDNVTTLPIEVINYIKEPTETSSKLSGAIFYNYRYGYSVFPNQKLELKEVYSTELEVPIDPASFSPAYLSEGDEPNGVLYMYKDEKYVKRVSYDVFDEKNNPLQITKEKDVPSSMLWSYKNNLLSASIMNASQDRVAYANFDSKESGNGWTIKPQLCISNQGEGISSNYYFMPATTLSTETISEVLTSKTIPQGKYKLTFWGLVWSQDENLRPKVNITGGTRTLLSTVLGKISTIAPTTGYKWKLYEYLVDITASSGHIEITLPDPVPEESSGDPIYSYIALDEVRLHPSDALMTTFTHEPGVGKTSETSPNNTTVFYEYDNLNRLKLIRDRDGNIVQRYTYNYKQ